MIKLFTSFALAHLLSCSLAHCGELPVIQMPQYVIAGVEQACGIGGVRPATDIQAAMRLPESATAERPFLPTAIVGATPFRPALQMRSGNGIFRVSAVGGAFLRGAASIETAGEADVSGYLLGGGVDRPPTRVSAGPRTTFSADAGAVRRMGSDVAFAPVISLDRSSFNRLTAAGTHRRDWFELGLGAITTPMALLHGRLVGRFLFAHTTLRNDGELSASLDHLTLQHSAPLTGGRLETRLDLASEVVSSDKTGHTHYSLEGEYSRLVRSDLLLRAGGTVYGGRVLPTPVAKAPGNAEGRGGAWPWLGAAWKPPVGGALDVAWRPGPQFEVYRELMARWPMLDTTARGVTVERVASLQAAYRCRLGSRLSGEMKAALDRERHTPYPAMMPSGDWTIVTRRSRAIGGRLRIEAELSDRLGLGGYWGLRRERTAGSSSDRAPLVSPSEAGVDLSYAIGAVTLAQSLQWRQGAPADFSGGIVAPDRLDWNGSLHWRPHPGLIARVGADNLLNRRRWELPGYDLPPLTIWAGVEWRGGPIW